MRYLVLCFLVLLLSTCGKTGDLYLPEKSSGKNAVEPVTGATTKTDNQN